MILAIDPGTEKSGYVVVEDGLLSNHNDCVIKHGIVYNELLLLWIGAKWNARTIVIERFRSNFQKIGNDCVDTIEWSARFHQKADTAPAPPAKVVWMPRAEAVSTICGNKSAGDRYVWEEIVRMFGGKEMAVGKKKNPGPLYGIKSHERAALALAVAYSMKQDATA